MAHTTSIKGMARATVNGKPDIVHRVDFELTVDNGESEVFSFMLIDVNDTENLPTLNNVIPFASLTEADVISWVESDVTFPYKVRHLEQRAKPAVPNQPLSPDLPWAQPSA